METVARNLINPLPDATDSEVVATLLSADGIRLERIVSHGQASPKGFWYDQDQAEWVLVLSGNARLAIEGKDQEQLLGKGDSMFLPAHCRHRVTWTDPNQATIWIALFMETKLAPVAHDGA